MKKPNKNATKPTWTALFLKALQARDDFMTLPQLRTATGANGDQATATLHHLCRRKAVSAMNSDGVLWFYATPESDERTKTLDERVPEEPGSRNRKKRAPMSRMDALLTITRGY